MFKVHKGKKTKIINSIDEVKRLYQSSGVIKISRWNNKTKHV